LVGDNYDCVLFCVEKRDGWIIARPTTKLDLTGEKAAHLLVDSSWDDMAVPSLTTSEQGHNLRPNGGVRCAQGCVKGCVKPFHQLDVLKPMGERKPRPDAEKHTAEDEVRQPDQLG